MSPRSYKSYDRTNLNDRFDGGMKELIQHRSELDVVVLDAIRDFDVALFSTDVPKITMMPKSFHFEETYDSMITAKLKSWIFYCSELIFRIDR